MNKQILFSVFAIIFSFNSKANESRSNSIIDQSTNLTHLLNTVDLDSISSDQKKSIYNKLNLASSIIQSNRGEKVACIDQTQNRQDKAQRLMTKFAQRPLRKMAKGGMGMNDKEAHHFYNKWATKYSCEDATKFIKRYHQVKKLGLQAFNMELKKMPDFFQEHEVSFCGGENLTKDYFLYYQFAIKKVGGLRFGKKKAKEYARKKIMNNYFSCSSDAYAIHEGDTSETELIDLLKKMTNDSSSCQSKTNNSYQSRLIKLVGNIEKSALKTDLSKRRNDYKNLTKIYDDVNNILSKNTKNVPGNCIESMVETKEYIDAYSNLIKGFVYIGVRDRNKVQTMAKAWLAENPCEEAEKEKDNLALIYSFAKSEVSAGGKGLDRESARRFTLENISSFCGKDSINEDSKTYAKVMGRFFRPDWSVQSTISASDHKLNARHLHRNKRRQLSDSLQQQKQRAQEAFSWDLIKENHFSCGKKAPIASVEKNLSCRRSSSSDFSKTYTELYYRYASTKIKRTGAPKVSHEDVIEFINQWMTNHSCEDSNKLTWESLGISKYARDVLKLSEKENMGYTSRIVDQFCEREDFNKDYRIYDFKFARKNNQTQKIEMEKILEKHFSCKK